MIDAEGDDDRSGIAASGNRTHRSLANYFTEYQNACPTPIIFDEAKRRELFDRERTNLNLSPREAFIMRDFVGKVEAIIEEHGGLKTITPEERLQLLKRSTEDVLLTGTTDLTFECIDKTHHVVDYKTGFLEQNFADDHIQLHSYMVMKWYTLKRITRLDRMFGHLLQVASDEETRHTITLAFRDQIRLKRKEIIRIIRQAEDPKSRRRVGVVQCRYCSARGTEQCPESQALVIDLPAETRKALTPSRMSRIVKGCLIARPIIDKTLREARAILKDDPEAIPEIELGKPSSVKTVEAITAAFERVKALGITSEEYVESLSLSLGSLVRTLYEKHKGGESKMSMKAARELIDTTLGDLIIRTEKEPSVKIMKSTGEEDDKE